MSRLVVLAVLLSLVAVTPATAVAQEASPAASPMAGPCVAPELPPGTPTPMEEGTPAAEMEATPGGEEDEAAAMEEAPAGTPAAGEQADAAEAALAEPLQLHQCRRLPGRRGPDDRQLHPELHRGLHPVRHARPPSKGCSPSTCARSAMPRRMPTAASVSMPSSPACSADLARWAANASSSPRRMAPTSSTSSHPRRSRRGRCRCHRHRRPDGRLRLRLERVHRPGQYAGHLPDHE